MTKFCRMLLVVTVVLFCACGKDKGQTQPLSNQPSAMENLLNSGEIPSEIVSLAEALQSGMSQQEFDQLMHLDWSVATTDQLFENQVVIKSTEIVETSGINLEGQAWAHGSPNLSMQTPCQGVDCEQLANSTNGAIQKDVNALKKAAMGAAVSCSATALILKEAKGWTKATAIISGAICASFLYDIYKANGRTLEGICNDLLSSELKPSGLTPMASTVSETMSSCGQANVGGSGGVAGSGGSAGSGGTSLGGSGGTSGSNGGSGGSSDASVGGAGGQGGSMDASAGSGGTDQDGSADSSETSGCTQSTKVCNGQQPQVCNNGAWMDLGAPCAYDCIDGECYNQSMTCGMPCDQGCAQGLHCCQCFYEVPHCQSNNPGACPCCP